MPEFLRLLPPDQAFKRWISSLPADLHTDSERIATSASLGRVLAADLTAPAPLPAFQRATVDGYAVRAADTYGASPSLPAYLALVGEVLMGTAASMPLQTGQAQLVHTGGMIPPGADAVVMLEDTQPSRAGEVEALRPVAVGQNMIPIGEDVRPGQVLLEAGKVLRPQEIGGLMALGILEVAVTRRPRVAILSTGDEVIDPQQEPGPGQVRDVNSRSLAALVEKAGGLPVACGILPDRFDPLLAAAQRAHHQHDLVVITAGSSVSRRDLTAEVIDRLGSPGVVVHGVAVKPGKPTILGAAEGIPIIGLPGNPVSALIIARVFIAPLLRRMLGQRGLIVEPTLRGRLTSNIASEAGREDYQPVRLVDGPDGLQVEPVFGRSNLIFTLVRADGLVRIPPEATGLPAGSTVEVLLF